MKSNSTKTTLRFTALVAGLMVLFASCGGHGSCGAYGNPKTNNTNSEHMAE
ncbi:MAG TPA: hypothetical protein VD905_16090 [Flavobacteriales bacterium]|nr:hypothetical protein [Flavobacteriales bacterium]